MPPRPDSNGFTKFIISAGVFLIVAAAVVPGFVLRDTGVLTISREDLRESTPTAKDELERRQGIARDAGQVAPYLGVAFLIGGGILIAFGIPRLKRQEKIADEHARAEVDKLHRELRPQTEDEREKRARAEVTEDKTEEVVSPGTSYSAHLQHWVKAEAEVLARLAEVAPPAYEFRSRVTLEGSANRRLLLDALLISQVDQLPDIVVEIKSIGRGVGRNLTNRMREAEGQLLRYLARYRRDSIGWLILHAKEELTARQKEEIVRLRGELADALEVSIVTPRSLVFLELPVPN